MHSAAAAAAAPGAPYRCPFPGCRRKKYQNYLGYLRHLAGGAHETQVIDASLSGALSLGASLPIIAINCLVLLLKG